MSESPPNYGPRAGSEAWVLGRIVRIVHEHDRSVIFVEDEIGKIERAAVMGYCNGFSVGQRVAVIVRQIEDPA